MKYKEIKFIKKDDGMYNIKLSSIYDNNCCEVDNYEVEEKIFKGLDILLKEERHYDNADYYYLSIYSYDELCERNNQFFAESPEDEYFSKITSCEFREAICELSPISRKRLCRYFFDKWTYEQIAEADGVSHVAVMYSINNALEKLKSKLGDDYIFNK